MLIVGSVATEEEKNEMEYITKIFLVGNRIRELAQQGGQNENNNKEKNK